MLKRLLPALLAVVVAACSSSNKKKETEEDRGLLWGTTTAIAGAVWETGKLVARTGYAVVSTGASAVAGGARAVGNGASSLSDSLYGSPTDTTTLVGTPYSTGATSDPIYQFAAPPPSSAGGASAYAVGAQGRPVPVYTSRPLVASAARNSETAGAASVPPAATSASVVVKPYNPGGVTSTSYAPSAAPSGFDARLAEGARSSGSNYTAAVAVPTAGRSAGGAGAASAGTGAGAGAGNIVIPPTAAGPVQKLGADELERFLVRRGLVSSAP